MEKIKGIEEMRNQLKDFKEICQPVVDYLNKNGCPHSTIIITQTSAELVSGEMTVPYEPLD